MGSEDGGGGKDVPGGGEHVPGIGEDVLGGGEDVPGIGEHAYILKGGSRGSRNPQTILNFPQKDCLRTRKVSRLHCLQSY